MNTTPTNILAPATPQASAGTTPTVPAATGDVFSQLLATLFAGQPSAAPTNPAAQQHTTLAQASAAIPAPSAKGDTTQTTTQAPLPVPDSTANNGDTNANAAPDVMAQAMAAYLGMVQPAPAPQPVPTPAKAAGDAAQPVAPAIAGTQTGLPGRPGADQPVVHAPIQPVQAGLQQTQPVPLPVVTAAGLPPRVVLSPEGPLATVETVDPAASKAPPQPAVAPAVAAGQTMTPATGLHLPVVQPAMLEPAMSAGPQQPVAVPTPQEGAHPPTSALAQAAFVAAEAVQPAAARPNNGPTEPAVETTVTPAPFGVSGAGGTTSTQSEAGTHNGADDEREQTPGDKTITAMAGPTAAMRPVDTAAVALAPTGAPAAEVQENAHRLAEGIRSVAVTGDGEARIHLQPENLGEVVVRVKLEAGHLSVDLQAARPEAREAVQAAMPRLEATLEQHGFKVENLSLNGGMNQPWNGSPSGTPWQEGQRRQHAGGWAFAPPRLPDTADIRTGSETHAARALAAVDYRV